MELQWSIADISIRHLVLEYFRLKKLSLLFLDKEMLWNIYAWTSKGPKQLFSPDKQRYLTYVRNCEEYYFYPILNWCLFRWTAVEWKWDCDTGHSRVVRHFTCKKCLIDQAFQVTSHLLEKCQKGAICCDNIAQTTVCNQTIAAKRRILFRWIYMYILVQFLVSVIILTISRT